MNAVERWKQSIRLLEKLLDNLRAEAEKQRDAREARHIDKTQPPAIAGE